MSSCGYDENGSHQRKRIPVAVSHLPLMGWMPWPSNTSFSADAVVKGKYVAAEILALENRVQTAATLESVLASSCA